MLMGMLYPYIMFPSQPLVGPDDIVRLFISAWVFALLILAGWAMRRPLRAG